MAVTDAEAIGRRDRGADPGLPAPIPQQHLGPLGKAVGILSIGCPTYQCDRFNTVSSGRSNRARGEHRLFSYLSRATLIQA